MKIPIFIAAIGILISCTKKLDVPPQNVLTPSEIKTQDDVIALLMGGYSSLQNANAFGEKYNTLTEVLIQENDIHWAGTFSNYTDIWSHSQVADNNTIYLVWANAYHTINIANTALSKLDLVSDDLRRELEGEAKFFRGTVYFYLVNLFAKPYSAGNVSSEPGVPLITVPVEGYDPARDKLQRASVEAVYRQVLRDLEEAAESLPEEADNFRASRYAALAMLSRVYMAQARYVEAATAANEVIESHLFSLNTRYADAFNNASNSPEDIFAIQQSSQSNAGTTNTGLTTFYASDPVGRGELQITNLHRLKYPFGDARSAMFGSGSSISGQQGLVTLKWSELYSAIPVLRLSEMYLTRAEANYRSGQQVGPNFPLADVNRVRARSFAPMLVNIADADVIVFDRYLELAFEGERFFTVKRLRLTVDGIDYDDPRMIFPIPQREIDLGNSLPQNEGY
jgi:starch-binding outer membrane protein, SusD/RagB family